MRSQQRLVIVWSHERFDMEKNERMVKTVTVMVMMMMVKVKKKKRKIEVNARG